MYRYGAFGESKKESKREEDTSGSKEAWLGFNNIQKPADLFLHLYIKE